MTAWYEAFKPRGSRSAQLLLAGVMWTTVGAGLFLAGRGWVFEGASGGTALLLFGAALLTGALKARFVLDRTAEKITRRIAERGESRCLGGFLSVRSWLLVAAMIVLGRVLRGGFLPTAALGFLYTAIGSGLVISSRIAWRARLTPGGRSSAQ